MKSPVIFSLLLVLSTLGYADTIHVPDDYGTIQEAITIAADGDSVIVRPGTYVENINFLGKSITVASEQGPEVTFIDGSNPPDPDFGSVVTLESVEGPSSILEGFTLTGGSGNYHPDYDDYFGGGIFITGSSPLITGNIITGNTAARSGGGIFSLNASPVIADNTVANNSAPWAGGIIIANTVPTPVATLVRNNVVTFNTSTYSGAGIWIESNADVSISGNVIAENAAGTLGGGIGIYNSSPQITNNLVLMNSADTGGGGLCCTQSAPALFNNTITENSAPSGGGMYCEVDSTVTIFNTIFWNNGSTPKKEIWIGTTSSPSTLSIRYSDIQGGMGSVHVEAGSTLNWGLGMIDEDPLFCSGPSGDYPEYYLGQEVCGQPADSPCVDMGNPFTPMIEGTTRTDCHPDTDVVDMGYHHPLLDTVTAELSCTPDSGVLPFDVRFSVTMGNPLDVSRSVAGRIDVTLAGGPSYQNWRAGFSNLDPGEIFSTSWQQTLPALGNLAGANVFELVVEDVTPPPYNQSPYPPAGDTDTSACTVTASAP